MVETKNILHGRWTKAEHERFMMAYEKFNKNWSEVQKVVKTRSLTQVRSHAQKMFLNKEKHGIDEDFSTQLSEQISYQDSSHEEPRTKKQRNHKKLINLQKSPNAMPIHSLLPKQEEKAADVQKQELNENQKRLNLALSESLRKYLGKELNSSYFMTCFADQFDYLVNGGNFISLCMLGNA